MRTHRSAFTLVEMMVAMTLTLFVMVILSQCFVEGLETFSGLKAIGDMQEQLRTTTTLLRADLGADHFEGKRRLSDDLSTEKIREGFFAIGQSYYQGTPPSIPQSQVPIIGLTYPMVVAGIYEGADPYNPTAYALPTGGIQVSPTVNNNILSVRSTAHWLHFTVRMRGNAREKVFSAPAKDYASPARPKLLNVTNNFVVPPQAANASNNYVTQTGDASFQEPGTDTINSAWAEVVYLLLQTGTTGNPNLPGGTGTPLYALYRCQYLVLPVTGPANNTSASNAATPYPWNDSIRMRASDYPNIALGAVPNTTPARPYFFNPNDLARGYSDPNNAPANLPVSNPLPPYNSRSFNPYSNPSPFTSNFPPTPPRGAALVLSNVISFQVQISKVPTPTVINALGLAVTPGDFEDLGPTMVGTTPVNIPFDTANYVTDPTSFGLPPVYGAALVTATNPQTPPNRIPPPNYSIQALRITLRAWDPRARLTRQVTLIQDM